VEPPSLRVRGDAFSDQLDGGLHVNRREHDRAVLVGCEKLRVERRGVVEKRREDFQVERAQVVNLDRAFVRLDLAPDVLQRTHPVPIRRERVEA
jgi:hypothetical protein